MPRGGGGPLRIALLTYRGDPHAGGQGVYVRHLGRALADLGHEVTVLSGPPYPELDDGVALRPIPSLDLYRPDDPFRRPGRGEFADAVDVLEYALMCTAAFPEPLTFTLRVARSLRRGDFDVVHDNQSLGYGLLAVERRGLPVVATIHHPITIDRRIELAAAPTTARRLSVRRWYSFTRMQRRVARRLRRVIAVSDTVANDAKEEFALDPARIRVIHNGVDTELFRPLEEVPRVSGRILTVGSSGSPMKGGEVLIEAVAKLRTERDVELAVVGKAAESTTLRRAAARLGMEDAVRFIGRVDALELVEHYARAEIVAIPSLYEGFSLPAVEAMSCGAPVVATTGGAVREVVGDEAGAFAPPGDAGALAAMMGRLLDDPRRRAAMGRAGRARVLERFSWRTAAAATVETYRDAMARC